jgi:hypothetical protein
MKVRNQTLVIVLGMALSSMALAQTVGTETQRDLNQQQRIEQGLKSGQLSTGEAAKLERGEARIDRMESNALKDGTLSPTEKARIQHAQNVESRKIDRLDHNGITGNPQSASSQRMQADVQRNINQEARIHQGVKTGALTNTEVGRLERGQARVDRREARAGADGHVGAGEQHVIQHTENVQSKRIWHKKHNAAVRPAG